jgi:hypothetical protein
VLLIGDPAISGGAQGREAAGAIEDVPRAKVSLFLNIPYDSSLQKLKRANHTWFVFEAMHRRAEKSLSDLSGTDVYTHNGNVRGVFTQLCNALVRLRSQPTTQDVQKTYRRLIDLPPKLQRQTGARSPFEARIFRDLVVAARALTRRQEY